MEDNYTVLGVTGLPSSGKGEFSNTATKLGFYVVVMGDVIRNELKKRNLKNTRENQNKIMVQLRKERGPEVVAQITLEIVKEAINSGKTKILIDGIRSISEVRLFQANFVDFKVIAIHASPMTRYKRARGRKREDDVYSMESFLERDQVELNVGLGNVIALADILITSEMDLDESHEAYRNVLDQLTTSSSSE